MNQRDTFDFATQGFVGLTERRLQVAIFVCPGFAPVDIIGVHTIFGVLPTAELHLVWKDREPLVGMPVFPSRATTTFAECPRDLDVLHIGAVPPDIFDDEEALAFLADRGARARYVTANCAGSLFLGAAGLLRGYRATSNFHIVALLEPFGAIPRRAGRSSRTATASPPGPRPAASRSGSACSSCCAAARSPARWSCSSSTRRARRSGPAARRSPAPN
jgi:hypothetical protein